MILIAHRGSRMAISNFDALMRLNDCLLTAGKHHEAIAMLTDAISKSPDSRLYFKRGFHHEQLNHAEDAIGDYSSAIEIEPNNPSYHLSRGCVLSHALESNIEAIEDFETVLRLDPNNLEAHRECCLCLLLVDQATKALSHANSAIRLSVSDSASHYCAGETLLA